MDSHCFPASQLPGASKLYSAYLSDFGCVKDFYFHAPTFDSVPKSLAAVSLPGETRAQVCEVLRRQNRAWGGDASVRANLDKLASGAVAVVTGQQAGLLTGPAYSIHKAVTAIALARKLSREGNPAVPIFWMATEDHDLAEVNQAHWAHRAGIETLRLQILAGEEGRSVAAIRLGESASAVARLAIDLLEGSESQWVEAGIARALRPEETFGSSFAKLLSAVFAGRGLILLDPADRELHRLSVPTYRKAIVSRAELTKHLLSRGKALERSGFHVQVKVTESSTPLFLNVNGKRTPLRQRGDKLTAGERSFSESELLVHLEGHPEDFSGNAVFRPVIQDSLLPTAVFVAGPAEIAYLAQSEVLYRDALGRMPVILPRAGFTIVELPVARLLKKYELDVSGVFSGSAAVRRKLTAQALPTGLSRAFVQGEKELRATLRRLGEPVRKLDKTLLGAMSTAERKILYQFLKLRDKVGRASALRSDVLARHEKLLLEALLPFGAPQERELCFLPFLARHGSGLLDALEKLAIDIGQHHLLFL